MRKLLPLMLPLLAACDAADEESKCGPRDVVVMRVIDGDTVELQDGTRVRYLLVDTPEVSGGAECWGPEAQEFNRSLVEGKAVTLSYDEAECTDNFGRTLAFVDADGRDVNALLLERGHAEGLYIPPGGEDRLDDYRALESEAMAKGAGQWGACTEE